MKATRASRARFSWRMLGLAMVAVGCVQAGGDEQLGESQQQLQAYDQGLYQALIEDTAFTSAMGGGSDWAAAFREFVSDSTATRLRLACNKTYTFQSTVDICRPVTIIGCGPSTVIAASAGVTPFRVRYAGGTCSPPLATGADTRIEDLTIREQSAGSVVRYGVWAEAAVHVSDVRVEGFSNGIRIDADTTRSGTAQSQANVWSITRSFVTGAEHAGVLVYGRDANAGLAERLVAQGNCTQVSKSGSGGPLYPTTPGATPAFPACGGVIDASAGGNVWNGLWTKGTTAPYPGARFEGFDSNGDGVLDDDTGHAVCMGCRKDETVSSVLAPNAIAVGNRSGYTGGGANLNAGRFITPITLKTPFIEPLATTTDTTPPLAYFELRDGTRMNLEQNGAEGLRGSWKGANAYSGWYWSGNPAVFTALP